MFKSTLNIELACHFNSVVELKTKWHARSGGEKQLICSRQLSSKRNETIDFGGTFPLPQWLCASQTMFNIWPINWHTHRQIPPEQKKRCFWITDLWLCCIDLWQCSTDLWQCYTDLCQCYIRGIATIFPCRWWRLTDNDCEVSVTVTNHRSPVGECTACVCVCVWVWRHLKLSIYNNLWHTSLRQYFVNHRLSWECNYHN